MHIPVSYQVEGETYENNLYSLVWRPEEVGIGNVCNNTDTMAGALQTGLAYMITHREELLPYNPDNGWGDYLIGEPAWKTLNVKLRFQDDYSRGIYLCLQARFTRQGYLSSN